MHPMLRRLDLNLLPIFDAVFRHRSVKAAADELALSTSALSHALARLRAGLNDPLFYREGHRMCPSVYACQLAPVVAAALASLNQQLAPQPLFDPALSDEVFKIAVTDYTAFAVFPMLMNELQHSAPGLRFELLYLSHNPALKELLAGKIDLALGFSVPDEIRQPELDEISWFTDDYVAISNRSRSRLTLTDYLAARHLVVTPWNEQQGVIDRLLAQRGHSRRVIIKTPSMLSAPFIVAQSDLLLTLPRFAAGKLQRSAEITIFELPFPVPAWQVKIYSHQRSGKRAATDWLKDRLQKLAASFNA